jgi:pimeloyl-ACP methyl ester carboxylesterase
MDLAEFSARRTTVSTPAGEIAYVDVGQGPATVFVHGLFMSGYLWRNVIGQLRSERRCIAIDLPGHGRTRVPEDRPLALPDQAEALEQLCDALGLETFDLVGNDTGGAVAQVFAASQPERIRSLVLNNCDVHDQAPPATFIPTVEAATAGQLAPAMVDAYAKPDLARQGLAQGYEHPERLSDETVREYFHPFSTLDGARMLERAITALRPDDMLAIEPRLAELEAPTLIVWGTGDTFFDVEWAYWLRDAIKGAERVVEISDAKLFLPDERADELVPILRDHWSAVGAPSSSRRASTSSSRLAAGGG